MKLGKLAAVLLATTCMGSSLLANKAAPLVQPGPIGGTPKALTSEDAIKLANTSHSPADVLFMQGMIVHHQQAVDMTALVKERTNQQDIVAVAGYLFNPQTQTQVTWPASVTAAAKASRKGL